MHFWSADMYTAAWRFAAEAHGAQKVPGSNLPYIAHVGNVAMEVMTAAAARGDVAQPDLAVQCALLHDVVEDTPVTVDEIAARFGAAVAAGVAALTKSPGHGTKAEKMADSLARIRAQPPEVWMVKLGDRITNLQPPPAHWSRDKIAAYRDEARAIHAALASACPVLGPRLWAKIEAYATHLG
jgi:(p)ppGpp synthase/HD superfamily hydrolase